MIKLARVVLVALLAVCVPSQAVLALSVTPQAASEHCHDGHDGHDGHGKPAGSHCGSCCTAAAIASVIIPVSASPVHDAVIAASGQPLLGDLPGGLDRPPRSF